MYHIGAPPPPSFFLFLRPIIPFIIFFSQPREETQIREVGAAVCRAVRPAPGRHNTALNWSIQIYRLIGTLGLVSAVGQSACRDQYPHPPSILTLPLSSPSLSPHPPSLLTLPPSSPSLHPHPPSSRLPRRGSLLGGAHRKPPTAHLPGGSDFGTEEYYRGTLAAASCKCCPWDSRRSIEI